MAELVDETYQHEVLPASSATTNPWLNLGLAVVRQSIQEAKGELYYTKTGRYKSLEPEELRHWLRFVGYDIICEAGFEIDYDSWNEFVSKLGCDE